MVCLLAAGIIFIPSAFEFLEQQHKSKGLVYEYQTLIAGFMAILAGLFIYLVPKLEFAIQRKAHRDAVRKRLVYSAEEIIVAAYKISNLSKKSDSIDFLNMSVADVADRSLALDTTIHQMRPEFFNEWEWQQVHIITMQLAVIKRAADKIILARDLASIRRGIESFIYQPAQIIREHLTILVGADALGALSPEDDFLQ